jgi:hypothetical protein
MEDQDKGKPTKKKKDRSGTRTRYSDGKSQSYLPHCQEPTCIIRVNWLIRPSIHPSGSGHFDFGYSNSDFWHRQTTRQYLRPCQVIIGSTLVPGRLVNRARVHALVLSSASRFWYTIFHDQPLGWEYAGRLLNTGRLCQFRLALEYERHLFFFFLTFYSECPYGTLVTLA